MDENEEEIEKKQGVKSTDTKRRQIKARVLYSVNHR
jgi:hypothetical protein